MRIGLEMFATQTAGRSRGIGRYGRNLAAALRAKARAGASHELIPYADASGPLDQVPDDARAIRPEPNLREAVARLTAENPDGLDAILFTNPLDLTPGYDPPSPPRGNGKPATLAVVYDLIPLIFPDDYLKRWPAPTFARRYHWTLERLRQYDRLLAISEATRRDLIKILNVPPDRVVTIGTGGDDLGAMFHAGSDADESADRAALDALGITKPFVFAVAATDPRKNVRGLLDAYSKLPRELRETHRLVLAAGIAPDDPSAAPIRQQAESLGILDALTITGLVSDDTLAALYRRCSSFVFPSLYEGFGLPIVEALRSAAPAIAGDNSSQPEVAGDAALLTNTADPVALAHAIERVLTDPEFARSLRERGPARAALFSWDAVATRTLAAIESLARNPTSPLVPMLRVGTREDAGFSLIKPRSGKTIRIAYFSPMPPHTSGIATYSASLVDALSAHAAIDVFHDAGEAPFARFQSRNIGCFDYRVFPRWNRTRPYDAIVYQMGNSPAHLFAYETLFNYPGIVVMHDPALASFHYERAIRLGGGLPMFRAALEAAHPEFPNEPNLADFETNPQALVAALTAHGLDMNRAIVSAARAVIVHSASAAKRLGPVAAGKTHVIPQGADALPPPGLEERARLRARLGLPAVGPIIARFGLIHPSKLDTAAIDAFAAILPTCPDALLLMVGEEADHGQARRHVESLGLNERIRFQGRPDDDRFLDLIRATDVGLALRRPPTNGESSGALVHLLRSGVATIVTDVGSFAGYPDAAVRKVAWLDDPSGLILLKQALAGLVANEPNRAALADAGRALIAAEHGWPRIAERYLQIIEPSKRPAQPHHGPHTRPASSNRERMHS